MDGENLELARSTIGDLQRLFDLLDDAVVIDNTAVGSEILPEFKGVFHGKRAVKRSIVDHVGGWDEYRFDVEEILEAGDSVIIFTHETGLGKRSRVPMERQFVQVWTFKDGSIVRMTTFLDRDEALAWAEAHR